MYDPWGIGESLRMAMRMYSHSKRGAGRTTMMLNGLRDGDTVVCTMRNEASRLKQLAHERGIEIQTIVFEPRGGLGYAFDQIMRHWDRKGAVYFDHMWFEAFYYHEIEGMMEAFSRLQNDLNDRRRPPEPFELAPDFPVHRRAMEALGGDPDG